MTRGEAVRTIGDKVKNMNHENLSTVLKLCYLIERAEQEATERVAKEMRK